MQMRILTLFIVVAGMYFLPVGLFNYMVLPQLESMQDFYQNADQIAVDLK